jgi:predicted nucleic acid-binding protein
METSASFEARSAPSSYPTVEARRLCRDVDLKDTPFVAPALHLDSRLWTGDDLLKTSLKAKGFDRFF